MDGAKKACNAKSQELTVAKVKCLDRKQWIDFVNSNFSGI